MNKYQARFVESVLKKVIDGTLQTAKLILRKFKYKCIIDNGLSFSFKTISIN